MPVTGGLGSWIRYEWSGPLFVRVRYYGASPQSGYTVFVVDHSTGHLTGSEDARTTFLAALSFPHAR